MKRIIIIMVLWVFCMPGTAQENIEKHEITEFEAVIFLCETDNPVYFMDVLSEGDALDNLQEAKESGDFERMRAAYEAVLYAISVDEEDYYYDVLVETSAFEDLYDKYGPFSWENN